MTTNRRLAAIMVTDVVLMGADEAGTLAVLKERRKGVLEPVVKAHGGRCARIREERGAGPAGDAKSEMWAQVLGLRSDFPNLTDDEVISVVVADYDYMKYDHPKLPRMLSETRPVSRHQGFGVFRETFFLERPFGPQRRIE